MKYKKICFGFFQSRYGANDFKISIVWFETCETLLIFEHIFNTKKCCLTSKKKQKRKKLKTIDDFSFISNGSLKMSFCIVLTIALPHAAEQEVEEAEKAVFPDKFYFARKSELETL